MPTELSQPLASVAEGSFPPPPGSVLVVGGDKDDEAAAAEGESGKFGRVRTGVGVPSTRVSPLSEGLGFNLFIDGILGIALIVPVACGRCCELDEDMLAVLLSELENPESRDVEWDGVPSVLESSSEYRCLSSKAGTVRMVEFMRFGRRGDKAGADVAGAVFPLAPLVVVRDMAELMVPSEAGVRVDRGEGRSCKAFSALLDVDLLGVVTGVVDGVTAVTDEGSWVIPPLASVGSVP